MGLAGLALWPDYLDQLCGSFRLLAWSPSKQAHLPGTTGLLQGQKIPSWQISPTPLGIQMPGVSGTGVLPSLKWSSTSECFFLECTPSIHQWSTPLVATGPLPLKPGLKLCIFKMVCKTNIKLRLYGDIGITQIWMGRGPKQDSSHFKDITSLLIHAYLIYTGSFLGQRHIFFPFIILSSTM